MEKNIIGGLTVISFLGRVNAKGGVNGAPRVADYQEATYRFDDGQTEAGRSFITCLFSWLKQQNKTTNQIIIAGTAGSMWGAVSELFDSDFYYENSLDILSGIEASSIEGQVNQEQLNELASCLSKSLDSDVQLISRFRS